MHSRLSERRFVFAPALLLLACGLAGASDWPRFRGPNGAGIAADKDVPVKWTAENVLWKTEIPGAGHSSPIVQKGRVFLQSSSKDGKERWLIAVDAATGAIVWKTPAPGHDARKHPLNTMASSTPACDGERVYAVFWDGEHIHLSAYDFKDGKQVWENDLGSFTSQHGVGHSPMRVGDKVILANDQDGSSRLLAFDARSGAKSWEVERKAFRTCYSTPFLHTRNGGGEELIVTSTAGITAYDPANGKINWSYTWSFPRKPLRTVASAIAAGDRIVANSGDGDGSRHLIAVKMGDKGDVTTSNLAWQKNRATPYVPCLLSRGEYLYGVNDKGMALCYRTRDGEEMWSERLTSGGFTASPVLVDGKVYAVAHDGSVYVFAAEPKFKLLARNSVGEPVSSTPAVADNHMFIRGNKHLFCIGKAEAKGAAADACECCTVASGACQRPVGEKQGVNTPRSPVVFVRKAEGEPKKVDTRIFELRTYTAAPGKMDALNARFRNHTNRLFEKHGMTIIGFWMPTKQKAGEEKLIYILAYPSKEAADKSWKAFREDPEWQKARAESEKNGALLAKPPESVYMKPTDYSPLK